MERNSANRKSSQSSRGKDNLKPVLVFLRKLAARMDRLDKKMALKFEKSSKETASLRKEMKQEIKSVRDDVAKYHNTTYGWIKSSTRFVLKMPSSVI